MAAGLRSVTVRLDERQVEEVRAYARTLAASTDNYVRAAELVRPLDGDTAVVNVDLGFYLWTRQSCRLAGLNCNELTQPGGPEARDATTRLLGLGPLTVESVHVDKFSGRFDAVVRVLVPPGVADVPAGSLDVNAWLIAQGYAVPWNGQGKKPLVPWPRVLAVAGTRPLVAEWVDLAA